MSLLDEAKAYKTKVSCKMGQEAIELALAWIKNEVSLSQVTSVINVKSSTSSYMYLARALREAYRQNLLK